MISNATGIFIFLLVCGIVASNPDRAVDCRKFVFAPLCRGVAAKRNLPSPGQYEPALLTNNESALQLLRLLDAAIASIGVKAEEDNQSGMFKKIQNEIENAGGMYQQDKANRFLRLLVESKKSSSARDNIPAQEFGNFNQFAHSNV